MAEMPARLWFTDDDEANALLAQEPMALLIGFRFVSGWVHIALGTWHNGRRRRPPGLVPGHPTLGDVDSAEALAEYQAAKREYKAKQRAGQDAAW